MCFKNPSTMHVTKDEDLSIPFIDTHAPRKNNVTMQVPNLEKRTSTFLSVPGCEDKEKKNYQSYQWTETS